MIGGCEVVLLVLVLVLGGIGATGGQDAAEWDRLRPTVTYMSVGFLFANMVDFSANRLKCTLCFGVPRLWVDRGGSISYGVLYR